MPYRSPLCLWVLVLAAGASASDVRGFMVADGVTGQATTPHGWSECKVYLAGKSGSVGATTAGSPPGWFSLRAPDTTGKGILYSLTFDGLPAFAFRPGIDLPESGESDSGFFVTGAHYSVMFNAGHEEWGPEPWVPGEQFYQTFVATGPHITRIATKLADKRPSYTELRLTYGVYKTSEGPPSSWKLISPVRTRVLSPTTDPIIHIVWVPFRSSDMTLVPGQEYAVRLWIGPGSTSTEFVVVARRDQGTGYKDGQLYIGDQPQPDWDAYMYISGGAEGTLVNHAPMGDFDLAELLGWNTRFGQTFRATGRGLAGVDVVFARQTGQLFDIPITFQLYDGPGGTAIGPPKTCTGVPGAFQGRVAAFWSAGEVTLTPGRTYYIEGVSEGLNIWGMREDIPDCEAYIDGASKAPADLMLSIAEYVGEQP